MCFVPTSHRTELIRDLTPYSVLQTLLIPIFKEYKHILVGLTVVALFVKDVNFY